MDVVTIATVASSAVTALVSFLTKGGETLAEKAAEEGFKKRGEIWEIVKGLFVEDDLIITNFSANPADEKTQGKLEGKLEERLKDNPEIASNLDKLIKRLEEMEKNQPSAKNVSKIENKDISNSFISNDVNQS